MFTGSAEMSAFAVGVRMDMAERELMAFRP
jgi:hypothetical protein